MIFGNIPARLYVGVMMFFAVLVNYTMRVNLSVNIVAMVPSVTNETQTEEVETLGWTSYQRAVVIGAYSWGYIVSNIIGGVVSEKCGPRWTVLVTMAGSVVLTFASPALARLSYLALTIARVTMGFLCGFTFPALHVLIATWAVPNEKGKFASSLVCGTIGTVVAWSIGGVVVERFGWEWGFYTFGILTACWCFPWLYYVYNTPQTHPRITAAEKEFITSNIKQNDPNKPKPIPPYGRILMNIPTWALIVVLFGNGWGIYFIQNASPMFVANVLKYNIGSTGILSSLSYLARAICSFLFGLLADYLITKNIMSVKFLRKSFVMFSHVLPGVMLLALTLVDSPILAITLMIVSLGLNGALAVTGSVNCQDLAPNFAGTIYGIGNSIGTTAGIIVPLVVAYFTESDETNIENWRPVFYIGSAVYIITGIVFMILGSTELQDFNEIVYSNDKDVEVTATENEKPSVTSR
ncbi:hypothetical protein JYU34_001727 [Plutella xylostella]|uniref:Major facilitator superfamily (MFS) profile domain-containing protein n=1 Tax=Plutella xylostella TaxID=51655 RepID=A0ABQ7R4Q3_PLUXY|nr:hypothetical protein JYU34_001727 [Plutella xylostella]